MKTRDEMAGDGGRAASGERKEGGLAVVTGASSGIGYELARLCAEAGYDLVVAADSDEIEAAAEFFRSSGVAVEAVEVDLARTEGVDELCEATRGRPVDLLLANAGHGLGEAFLDQEFDAARHVIDTNVTGTVYLIHRIGRDMRARGQGRILITGSIAGFGPGPYSAVYNATKAFVDSFSLALRHELEGSGVSVTCLMPGATETDFFDRAGMQDTKVARVKKADPASVAKIGFDAMMAGAGDVVAGLRNKLEVAMSNVLPAGAVAQRFAEQNEPGSGQPDSRG